MWYPGIPALQSREDVNVHRSDGLFAMGQSLEFSALVLFLLLVFLVSGAGRLSVDHSVFGSRPARAAEPAPQT